MFIVLIFIRVLFIRWFFFIRSRKKGMGGRFRIKVFKMEDRFSLYILILLLIYMYVCLDVVVKIKL